MNAPTLSRELALRIGLAAHALPGIEPRRLIEVLAKLLGSPFTEAKLASITVSDLKTGLSNLDGEEEGSGGGIPTECYKAAVRQLWGDEADTPDVPEPQPLAEGDIAGSIRLAFASNTGEQIDGHFGTCLRFLIYQVSLAATRLVDVRSCAGAYGAEDKNAFRANLIADCDILYVQSIGGPAAAKVVKAGVHPIKCPQGGDAGEHIAQLQAVMAGSPPPWLAKIMGIPPEQRISITQEEEA